MSECSHAWWCAYVEIGHESCVLHIKIIPDTAHFQSPLRSQKSPLLKQVQLLSYSNIHLTFPLTHVDCQGISSNYRPSPENLSYDIVGQRTNRFRNFSNRRGKPRISVSIIEMETRCAQNGGRCMWEGNKSRITSSSLTCLWRSQHALFTVQLISLTRSIERRSDE